MRLSKKKEKALSLAIAVMSSHLEKGQHENDTEFEEAINELIDLKERSVKSRIRAKKRKERLDSLLVNSNTITLDGKWYDENIKNK